MHVHCWKGEFPNFGDNLNDWFWDRFLPGFRDVAPDVLLVGIGTVLTAGVPRAPKKVVVGSGVGYGRLADIGDGKWDVRAVRGPLSARALSLPATSAITDPAILLSDLDEFAERPQTIDVAFMPHWESAAFGRWPEACAAAGIHYIDPCQPTDRVIDEIARSRHVLAESLHAAIVADSFGKTWLPVVSSPRILPFKWVDWCLSMGLEYRPIQLPMTTVAERLYKSEPTTEPFAADREITPRAVFDAWRRTQGEPLPCRRQRLTRTLQLRAARLIQRHRLRKPVVPWERYWIDRTAAQLMAAKDLPGFCSQSVVRAAHKRAFYDLFDDVRQAYFPSLPRVSAKHALETVGEAEAVPTRRRA